MAVYIMSPASTDLDDTEAQHRCGDVADPHTRKHRHAHTGEENRPRLRACLG